MSQEESEQNEVDGMKKCTVLASISSPDGVKPYTHCL